MAKYEKVIVTPTGKTNWPSLNQPDDYMGKLQYKTGLLLDPQDPEVKAYFASLEELLKLRTQEWLEGEGAKFKNAYSTNEFIKADVDKEGNMSGLAIMNFKSNNIPAFVDSKGVQIKGNAPIIRGGAEVKVAFQPKFYAMAGDTKKVNGLPVQTRKVGLAIYLQAVQIINLNQSNGAGAFGVVEGGFEYDANDYADEAPFAASESEQQPQDQF